MADFKKAQKVQFKAVQPQYFEEQKFIARDKKHLYQQIKFRKQQLIQLLDSKVIAVWDK